MKFSRAGLGLSQDIRKNRSPWVVSYDIENGSNISYHKSEDAAVAKAAKFSKDYPNTKVQVNSPDGPSILWGWKKFEFSQYR